MQTVRNLRSRRLHTRGQSPRKKSMSSSGAFGRGLGLLPVDSAVGRPSNSQQTAPANGRQMIAVAQSQRGIRRTAYGGA
jgi:hypothetical protein